MKDSKLQFDDQKPAMKTIREALGMTQMAFAQELGVNQTTVARWESGARSPVFTIKQIKALEKLLKQIGMKFKDLPDDLGVSR